MTEAGRPDLDQKYRELQPALLRHLRYVHPTMAEDLAADVWAEVAAALPRFSGDDGAFRAWVFTLARRRVLDSFRRSNRRPVEPLDEELPALDPVPGYEDEAVERMSGLEAIATVRRVLPSRQAEVVLLRVVGGYCVDRVAGITGMQPVNVRVTQHRALRRLRTHFDPEGKLSA